MTSDIGRFKEAGEWRKKLPGLLSSQDPSNQDQNNQDSSNENQKVTVPMFSCYSLSWRLSLGYSLGVSVLSSE
jgi:hypothetical protein